MVESASITSSSTTPATQGPLQEQAHHSKSNQAQSKMIMEAEDGPAQDERGSTKGGRGRGGKRGGSARGGGRGGGSTKLRGFDKDAPDVRLSKTISWLLRHGALQEGLEMRSDGFVRVNDLMKNKKLKPLGLTLEKLQDIITNDAKQRFSLICEPKVQDSSVDGTTVGVPAESASTAEDVSRKGLWFIKANQGHSLRAVQLELKPITHVQDIPSGVAVHGTTNQAWNAIQKEGLSKMNRNHIHLAQGVAGEGVISGMRKSSQVLIYIDVMKALDAGIKFYLSDNGVVLTEGDESGHLGIEYFRQVVTSKGQILIPET